MLSRSPVPPVPKEYWEQSPAQPKQVQLAEIPDIMCLSQNHRRDSHSPKCQNYSSLRLQYMCAYLPYHLHHHTHFLMFSDLSYLSYFDIYYITLL